MDGSIFPQYSGISSHSKGACIVFVLLQNASPLGEKKHYVNNNYSVCGARHFEGPGLLQHCRNRGDDYHSETAFYLTTMLKNGMGLTQAAVHHGTNDQSRKTAGQISGHYYQSVDSQESDHPYQVNESIVDNACDSVGKDTSTLSGQKLPCQRAHDNDESIQLIRQLM